MRCRADRARAPASPSGAPRCRRPWPAPTRRDRRAAPGVTSASTLEERIQEVASLGAQLGQHGDGGAGVDQHEVAGADRGDERGVDAPRRRAPCAPTAMPVPSTVSTSPGAALVGARRCRHLVVARVRRRSRAGPGARSRRASAPTARGRGGRPIRRGAPARSRRRPTARGRRRRSAGASPAPIHTVVSPHAAARRSSPGAPGVPASPIDHEHVAAGGHGAAAAATGSAASRR